MSDEAILCDSRSGLLELGMSFAKVNKSHASIKQGRFPMGSCSKGGIYLARLAHSGNKTRQDSDSDLPICC
jgi:hypothetical protein